MRIVVTGAGTVGHVSPVLAVVDALEQHAKRKHTRLRVLYIGRREGVERQLAQVAGLEYVGVSGGKYRRAPGGFVRNLGNWQQTVLNVRDVASLGWGTLQSLYHLWRFRPEVVFNKAGATGLPVGLAARLLKIPMVIHEPDVIPGLANRTLSTWASAIAVGFPVELYSQFPADKLSYTGTPVRSELLSPVDRSQAHHYFFGPRPANPNRPVVLIMGGSQGARAINELVEQALPELLRHVRLIHITGTAQGQRGGARQGADDASYYQADFLDASTLAQAYAVATVVVARAGANTVAELASLAKPTILIPNQVMAAHQQANAEFLRSAGAAQVLSDDSSVEEFTTAIIELTDSPKTRKQLSQAIKAFDQSQATERLADIIKRVAKSGREA